jgi:hypothetical protein
MDFSKLSRWEVVGAVASLTLVISLFLLDWYHLAPNEVRDQGEGFICGVGEFECTGWETFPILRWLLLLAASAPLVLAYIVASGNKLSWPPGELTMISGFIAFVLIAYNGIIDPPGSNLEEIGITKQVGYYVALLSAIGISAAGVMRAVEAQKGNLRKTPGTV